MGNKKKVFLTDMKNGQNGVVIGVSGGIGIISKLEALGVRKGVKILKKSAHIGRGPIIVIACGTEMAIGYGMASRIIVEVAQ